MLGGGEPAEQQPAFPLTPEVMKLRRKKDDQKKKKPNPNHQTLLSNLLFAPFNLFQEVRDSWNRIVFTSLFR